MSECAREWNRVADHWESKVGDEGDVPRKDAITPTVLSILNEKVPSGARVLDLGCGNGFLTRALLDNGYDAVGCDASEAMAAYAAKRVGSERVMIGEIQKLDSSHGPFQCVVTVHALNSLPDLDGALRSVASVLVRDGWLIAVIPHPCFYYSFLGYAERYGEAVSVEARLAGLSHPVTEYLRPLASYFAALNNAGLRLAGFFEPVSPERVQAYFKQRNASSDPSVPFAYLVAQSQ